MNDDETLSPGELFSLAMKTAAEQPEADRREGDTPVDNVATPSFPEWLRWQPIDSYPVGEVALTRSAHRMVFGFRVDGIWHEMIGSDEVEVLGYFPLEWAAVPKDRWADYAFG